MDEIVKAASDHMKKSFESLRSDFSSVRSSKANAHMVEDIEVNAYPGSPPLKVMEVATISVPDPKTIVVSPFDMSIIGQVEKAIAESGLGINPVVTENIVRLTVPPLTEERRQEMVKLINQKAESGRVSIRQVRQDAMHDLKKLKEEGHISEDDIERGEKEVQRETDDYIKEIDVLREQKEQELMTV